MQTTTPTGTLYRTATLVRTSAGGDRRVELSFASAAPVPRPWGLEVLRVTPEAVRLGRLMAEGPVLIDHDTNRMVGKVERCWLENERARASVRFGTSTLAQEAWDDVQGGIRTGVSFGYIVHEMEEITGPDDQERTFLVTDWEPLEITLATIPADVSVGVNRSLAASPQGDTMDNTNTTTRDQAEVRRQEELRDLGRMFNAEDLAERCIRDGGSEETFRRGLLERMAASSKPTERAAVNLNIPRSDMERFSITRAVRALAFPHDRRAQDAAGLEHEVSNAYAERVGRAPRGLFIPHEVLNRSITKSGSGGNLVAEELLDADFVSQLRSKTIILKLARMLTGLRGDVAIPRQNSGAVASWVGEDEGLPAQSPTFDQVTMSAKSCGAYTYMTRKMLIQSTPDVERLVQDDLASAVAHAIDAAAINGSGSGNEPRGIINTSGVGAVEGGANGATPSWNDIVDLETAVASQDADAGSMAYLTTPTMRGVFKATEKASGTGQFCWESPLSLGAAGALKHDGILNGYQAFVSNQVPSTLDKGTSVGVCHAILFGDFSSLVVGLWGGLDINLDTATSADKGALRIVVFQDADVALRHPESFAVMKDALPA